jgi:hypothetical protein
MPRPNPLIQAAPMCELATHYLMNRTPRMPYYAPSGPALCTPARCPARCHTGAAWRLGAEGLLCAAVTDAWKKREAPQ